MRSRWRSERRRGDRSGRGSVLDDRRHAAAVESVAALEEVELDEKRQPDDIALEPLDQLDRALDRSAGRQEIIDDQDLLAGLDRIAMDLEGVRPVFEGVLDRDRLRRQLAKLPNRHETGVQLVGHR